MKVRLIVSPYDTGHRGRRMGAGPERLVQMGLSRRLAGDGHWVEEHRITLNNPMPAEIADGFAVMTEISREVQSARAAGAIPVVLAGNCIATVGAVAGHGRRKPGLLWLDSHGDLNTPDGSASGYLDGMGLAILAGDCWRTLAAQIPGFMPLPEEKIILAGTRDLDPDEVVRLSRSDIVHVPGEVIRAAGDPREGSAAAPLAGPLATLAGHAQALHLHIDLDVLDGRLAPANHFRPPAGGLTPDELLEVVEAAGSALPIGSVAITAYDPAVDPDGVTADAAIAAIRVALATLAEPASPDHHASSGRVSPGRVPPGRMSPGGQAGTRS